MHRPSLLAVAVVMAAGALTGGTAQAGPLGAINQATAPVPTSVQQAAYRHCWRSHGQRHCRYVRHGSRVYGYNSRYYPRDARHLRYGSQRWWDQMEREDRAGTR
jgi:hypothetical protein